jgi:thiazole synthase
MLATARYPSPASLRAAVIASGTQIVTVSLRRETADAGGGGRFWEYLRETTSETGCRILPNTAGCYGAREAVTTAHMARELFDTNWIKLEVIGDDASLAPDPFGLVEAAATLVRDGFEVFPYTTTDLVVAERLLAAGCRSLMPWGAPIGTGRGLVDPVALATMRQRFPGVPLIVDAGIGRPSHAAQALELGMDGVLLNTAVATAGDPVRMAQAFRAAVEAGRWAFEAGPMAARLTPVPSSPHTGRAFRDGHDAGAEVSL